MNTFIQKINSSNYNHKIVSAEQMAKIDRVAIRKFGISLLQMMELAGLRLASLCTKYTTKTSKVLVLVGSGHNGGGGLVAAKHLHGLGYNVTIFLTVKNLKPTTKHQLNIIKKLQVQILTKKPNFTGFDLLIDSILGYNLKGKVKEPTKSIIEALNSSNTSIISLDLPSGLNPNTGEPEGVAIKASATLTLAAPKIGLMKSVAKSYTGQLYLADIGIPKEVFNLI